MVVMFIKINSRLYHIPQSRIDGAKFWRASKILRGKIRPLPTLFEGKFFLVGRIILFGVIVPQPTPHFVRFIATGRRRQKVFPSEHRGGKCHPGL